DHLAGHDPPPADPGFAVWPAPPAAPLPRPPPVWTFASVAATPGMAAPPLSAAALLGAPGRAGGPAPWRLLKTPPCIAVPPIANFCHGRNLFSGNPAWARNAAIGW